MKRSPLYQNTVVSKGSNEIEIVKSVSVPLALTLPSFDTDADTDTSKQPQSSSPHIIPILLSIIDQLDLQRSLLISIPYHPHGRCIVLFSAFPALDDPAKSCPIANARPTTWSKRARTQKFLHHQEPRHSLLHSSTSLELYAAAVVRSHHRLTTPTPLRLMTTKDTIGHEPTR